MSASANPDAESLLRAIAAASPGLWFPQRHAEVHGISREALTEPLWLLRQTGLIEVGDWVKGLGQGLRLSSHGEKAVATAEPLVIRPVAVTPTLRPDVPLELVRGDEVRNAVLDPPPAVVAPTLLYVNIAWFAIGCLLAWRNGVGLMFLKGGGHPGALETLMNTGAVSASAVWHGDWWRLITCCFVHIGLFHLLCNMLMLGLMGPFAESLWGRRRFALIYGVSGVAGSAVAMALNPISPSGAVVVMAGASGALWGMLLGIVVWVIRARRHLPPELIRDWARRLMFMVVMNVAVSFAPGVSAEAHFGGGAAGALVAWSVATGHRRPRLCAIGGLSLALLGSLLLLAGAMRWSEGWKQVKDRENSIAQAHHLAELAANRMVVHKAIGPDWVKLSPSAVTALHLQFQGVLPARVATGVSGPASLGKAAEKLREAAAQAITRLPAEAKDSDLYRAYLTAVADLAAAVRDELARKGRKDTPEVDAAWQAFTRANKLLSQLE